VPVDLRVRYLLLLEKDMDKAYKYVRELLSSDKDSNFLPYLLSKFPEKKVIKMYSSLKDIPPTENNYRNFIYYFLLLYSSGKYNELLTAENKHLVYQIKPFCDKEEMRVLDYLLYAAKRRVSPLEIIVINGWSKKILREIKGASR